MKSVLICPVERPAVATMVEMKPLALLPVLGKLFIEHWLEQLAILGAKDVRILAVDRPEQVRAFVADGAKWGLRVEVFPEMRELSVEEARAKHFNGNTGEWLPRPNDVILADHLPGLAKFPPFESYAAWYQVAQAALARRAFPNYIGLREVQPNVWVGRRSRISKSAVVKAPCWIGENVWIGGKAQIGPMAVIEDRAFVEADATVSASLVGPETYVGPRTEIQNCLAYGRHLINWKTNSSVMVAERFLLSELRAPRVACYLTWWMARLAALLVLVLTLPMATAIAFRSWRAGQPAFRLRKAVRPSWLNHAPCPAVLYHELLNTNRWWRRWPQLWNVFQGEFAWVGNRPLTPIQAGRLSNDFERLWLAAPAGLFSLADAEGSVDSFDDDARAHSSFYAVCATRQLRLSVLARVAAAIFTLPRQGHEEEFPVPLPEPVVKHQGQV